MENQLRSKSKSGLSFRRKLETAILNFSKAEKIILILLGVVLVASTAAMLHRINNSFMVEMPRYGGSITEGILGTPRFVNPVLSASDADRDVSALVYNGLLRKGTDGSLYPDLARDFEVSEDGTVYTFYLKEGLLFHDGTPLAADDVVFTINAVQDPVIKSPRRGSWDGVAVEKISDLEIRFTLRQPYASFLENTTLGIMPAHIWENSPIELNDANTNPIGSGPYKVASVSRQTSGIIDGYELESFKGFALGEPYIKKMSLRFYQNEEALIAALRGGAVAQASSVSPDNASSLKDGGYRILSSPLPRIFGLFFNQNQNQLFTDKSVLEAANIAIDKDRIVRQVLLGYGIPIASPIPTVILSAENNTGRETRAERMERARGVLQKGGWKIGESNFLEKSKTENGRTTVTPLEFVISTGNAGDLTRAAALIQEDLAELGMKIEVRTFETGNLNQAVIRPRRYDALLFGQIVQSEPDLFAFWHSSQRRDPGLNVAMYTNARVDKILEEVFITLDREAREAKYREFEAELAKDMSAVFLYSPEFIYVPAHNVEGVVLGPITLPADRFSNVYSWYVKTDKIWKIFSEQ